MDFNALRARCKSRFRDTANAIYSDDDWDGYLHDAERDVLGASPWWPFHESRYESLSVAAQAQGASLPLNSVRVDNVFNSTDGYPLRPISGHGGWQEAYPYFMTSFGPPVQYRLLGGVLEVLPRPAVATTLVIEYRVPVLAASGDDSPAWPEQWHHILISGAMARAYEDDGNLQQAQVHWAKFGQLLEQMKDDLLVSRQESYHEIADLW